jgi:hypothetical protein
MKPAIRIGYNMEVILGIIAVTALIYWWLSQ